MNLGKLFEIQRKLDDRIVEKHRLHDEDLLPKKIFLTKNKFALVDYEDYEHLKKYKWYFANGYARRNIRMANGKRKIILMHRIIMNTPKGMETDHINGDTLDNRKCNLRICTKSKNQMNKGRVRKGTSKYKGVSYYITERHKTGKWVARITVDNKTVRLGYFSTEKEAAKAYNEAAKKYHGEYARLNEVGA